MVHACSAVSLSLLGGLDFFFFFFFEDGDAFGVLRKWGRY